MSRFAKDDPRAMACIEAIIAVCAEHGFSLAHEDSHGGFILEERKDQKSAAYNENWLREAFVDPSTP